MSATTIRAFALLQALAAPPPPPAVAATLGPMAPPDGRRPDWADEFDAGPAPDPARWRYDTTANRTGWYNNELQYYAADRRENARIEEGRLIVEARADGDALGRFPDHGGQAYSSARLVTRGAARFTYGFFEIRARLPCGTGTWPAIWMLGEGPGRWPDIGEIDIMEHVGKDPGVVHGTVHTGAFNHAAGTHRTASVRLPTACDAFHDYQLDWTPERIRIGVDGQAFYEYANGGSGDPARWPFDRPHYLILNVAVGGDWGGPVAPDALPARMEVDHVRIWKREGDR